MAMLDTVERLHTSTQWALVERVLASQQFRRTARLQKFLRFVAGQSIDQGLSAIPEQDIGIAVFGRHPDYDTQIDNIVRVSAGDLRRRLEHYFLDEGLREEIVVEMPRGYALVFRSREISDRQAAPPTADAFTVDAADVSAELKKEHLGLLISSQPANESGNDWKRWWLDARTLCLIVALMCAVCLACWSVLRAKREPWQQTRSLEELWSPFLGRGSHADLVLGDSSLALVKSLTHSGVSLSDYLGYGFKHVQTDPRFDASTRQALFEILTRNIGSLGDFQAARNVLQLTSEPTQLVVGSAHDFLPDSIRGGNVILVGSNVSNPWVDLYREQRTLILENESPGSVAGIRNLRVQPGEQAFYRLESGQNVDSGFAVIAFLKNIEPDKRVLIIEGTDSAATLAASNFVTSAAGAEVIANQTSGGQLPGHLEILLRSSKLLGTALQAKVLAVHSLSDNVK